MFVSDELNRSLNDISTESGLKERAFDLVEEAASGGWLDDLYHALCQQNSKNPHLIQLQEELQDTSSALTIAGVVNQEEDLDRLVIGQEGSGTAVVREVTQTELIEPENSAHLVIAVFWKGEKKLKQFRVSPKLCYRSPQTSQIVHKPLIKAEDIDAKPLSQNRFPEFLQNLHTFALSKLRGEVADRPWKLAIELFLPLDVLCLPLSAWCGADGVFLEQHSVVVGCSDRFDAHRPDDALKLYNQLELKWESFFRKVPDVAGASLTALDWLDSTHAVTRSMASYTGFRCFGKWLVPGEWDKLDATSQQKWKDLVQFGVPLALWICQGSLTSVKRRQVFDALIQGTRFELLDRIPAERGVLQRSGHCVGVLYEDLNYTPERPKLPEQQFFSWPGFS